MADLVSETDACTFELVSFLLAWVWVLGTCHVCDTMEEYYSGLEA